MYLTNHRHHHHPAIVYLCDPPFYQQIHKTATGSLVSIAVAEDLEFRKQ